VFDTLLSFFFFFSASTRGASVSSAIPTADKRSDVQLISSPSPAPSSLFTSSNRTPSTEVSSYLASKKTATSLLMLIKSYQWIVHSFCSLIVAFCLLSNSMPLFYQGLVYFNFFHLAGSVSYFESEIDSSLFFYYSYSSR
jgi:hypothetical protein